MKKTIIKRILSSSICAALLFTCALPASAAWTEQDYEDAAPYNLISNPGFEDGDWMWETAGAVNIEEGAAHTGRYGMSIWASGSTAKQQVRFPGPGEYELKLALNAKTTNNPVFVYTRIVTATGTQSLNNVYYTNVWQRVAQTFTVTETQAEEDAYIEIEVRAISPVFIDEVFLARKDNMPPPYELDEGENAISNPGFETGTGGWETYQKNAAITAASKPYAYSGQKSLKASSTSNAAHGAGCKLPSSTEAGEYEISAYVYAPSANSEAELWAGIRGNLTGLFVPIIPNINLPITAYDGWVKVSFTVWLEPQETRYLVLSINDGSDFYVDDVSVIPTHIDIDYQEPEPEPQPQNLLQNPGFETGLSGWTQQGAPNSFSTDGQAYSGAHAAYFGYFASEPMQSYLEQTAAAGAGSYTFSAMVKPDATLQGVGCMLMLEALDKNGAVLATKSSAAVSDPAKGWQRTQVSLAAPAGTVSLRAKIGGIYCTGAFYVDDAALVS